MKDEFAAEHPQVVKALEKLSGKITEDQMIDMNYQVNVEGKQPADVAREFLKKKRFWGGKLNGTNYRI